MEVKKAPIYHSVISFIKKEKKMKKVLKLSMSLFAILSLTGCTLTSVNSEEESSNSSTSVQTGSIITTDIKHFYLDKDKKTDISKYISITDEYGTSYVDKLVITSDEYMTIDGTFLTCSEVGEHDVKFTVQLHDYESFGSTYGIKVYNPYNVFAVNATMPPLFSLPTLVSDDTPSLVWLERTGTFDFDNLPTNVIASWEASQSDAELCNSTFTELLNKVKEIGTEDPYSRFTLYRDDVRSDLDLYMFLSQGISEDRYEVKMVPDGSWSYNSAISSYTGADSYAAFEENKDAYLALVQSARDGELDASEAVYNGSTYYNSTIAMAQRDNFEYLLQYPEYIASKDPGVQAEIDSANITEAKPDVMYNSLTEDQQEEFRTILSLDKDTYDSTYFTATNDKPYLIITGTNPVTGSLTDEEFENVVDQIVAKYGDDYNFAFKPHPAAMLDSNTVIQSYFADQNIVELPGRLPMEALTWVYNDYALGGFDSSLYMCVPTGNTKFFICKDADSLSTVTKNLYDAGLYGDCDFFQPIETTD